jgi:hypothetical protein
MVTSIQHHDGETEVVIHKNADGRTYNAVMRDIDSGGTIAIKTNYPSIKAAMTGALKMLYGETGERQ